MMQGKYMKRNLFIRFFKECCLNKRYIYIYLLIIVSMCISAITTALQPKYQASLIDNLENGQSQIANILLLFLLIVIISYSMGSVITLLAKMVSENMACEMRKRIHEKLYTIDSKFFRESSFSNLMAKSEQDVENIKECGITGIIVVISNVLKIITCVPYMLDISFFIGMVNLLLIVLVPFVNYIFKKMLEKAAKENIENYGNFNKTFMDLYNNWENTKIFESIGYAENRFNEDNRNYKKSSMKQIFLYIGNNYVNILLQFVGIAVIWLLGIYELYQGVLSIGELLALCSYQAMLSSPMSTISNYFSEFRTAKVALEDIYDYWDYKDERKSGEVMKEKINSIKINRLGFSYKDKKVLDSITMQFENGKIYALIGRSGIGKSTIVNLLSGEFADYEGEILINDKDMKLLNLRNYRKQIAYVKQKSIFYQDSIYNNLELANKRKKLTVQEACGLIGVKDEIENMHLKWDTILSENASNLSVGQAKRIDIARNYLKESSIYIFDEATAAIDKEKRELFYKLIKKLAKTSIVILISHNEEDLKYVDDIYELDTSGVIRR